jgi:hypothetical protein
MNKVKANLFSPLFLLLFAFYFSLPCAFANADESVISAPPPSGPVIALPPASPCSTIPCEKIFHPPEYKVVFHNISGQTHILVSKKTTVKQLENLIHYLAEERRLNEFEKIGLPPTGSGDYARGSILVFNEVKWARGEKLTNPKIKEKTYSRKVLAEYIWNNHSETAYIGPKSLFSRSLPR